MPGILTCTIWWPTFGNMTALSFYCLHNVSTPNQSWKVSCVIFVCKHLVRFFEKHALHLNTPQNSSASWGLQMGFNLAFKGLMYSIYTLCLQYVILLFTYLLGFPSWFIMAAKYLNVYICPTLPCYNFTSRFLSSWILIIVLCTMCQTHVTLMHHGKIVLIQILAKQAK